MATLLNGYENFHSQAKPEYASMWNGSGERIYYLPIAFSKPFAARPNLVISCYSLDCDAAPNTRYTLLADAATMLGFNLVLHTWGDTRIWQIGAAWFAYESRLSLTQPQLTIEGEAPPLPAFPEAGSHSPDRS